MTMSIDYETLKNAPPLGSTAKCKNCGERHDVIYGKEQMEDGTWVPSTTIAAVRCPKNNALYLVGVEGKDITGDVRAGIH